VTASHYPVKASVGNRLTVLRWESRFVETNPGNRQSDLAQVTLANLSDKLLHPGAGAPGGTRISTRIEHGCWRQPLDSGRRGRAVDVTGPKDLRCAATQREPGNVLKS
jgi:hypothetical protein